MREIIAGIVAAQRWKWIQDYYSPEQKKVIDRRSRNVTPEQLAKWNRQWSEVLLGFQRLLDRKRKPDDPEAQRLAEKMGGLVAVFTQGDKGIEQSLGRAFANLDKLPKDERPCSVELQKFMFDACNIQRKVKK